MPNSTPSHTDPIRLAAARSPREERNSLIRGVLGLNLTAFESDSRFFLDPSFSFTPSFSFAYLAAEAEAAA